VVQLPGGYRTIERLHPQAHPVSRIAGRLGVRPRTDTVTAQGNARNRFRRAIERRNLLGAETAAREMGVVDLHEALELVVLVAEVAPARLDGFARRWLARLADERALRLNELDVALTALRALPSSRAVGALRALL
jgi:hypothetical protein